MTLGIQESFNQALQRYPEGIQKILATIPENHGRLDARHCRRICMRMGISLDELMVRLLPLAQTFALTPVSNFHVGAVAQAAKGTGPGSMGLYLGANLEFPGVALNLTIHAEQCASINAWHQGGRRLSAIAVTDSPCGYCRQFLQEWIGDQDIRIITAGGRLGHEQKALPGLLPTAFGPRDLGKQQGLGAGGSSLEALRLKGGTPDALTALALEAAQNSYAPYSGNLAGAAALLKNGDTLDSCYIESAAFNPSLSPMQAMAIRLVMAGVRDFVAELERLVLVEKEAVISQLGAAQVMVKAWAPEIRLEYQTAINS
jgi:cytidine deaminase